MSPAADRRSDSSLLAGGQTSAPMYRIAILIALVAGGVAVGADPPARKRGEFLRMWDAILSGQPPVAGFGWFGPPQLRYTWDRLKGRDTNRDGRVSKDELGGSS